MFTLGVILLIIGALLDIGLLYSIGGLLVVVGAVLWLLGRFGNAGPTPGSRHDDAPPAGGASSVQRRPQRVVVPVAGTARYRSRMLASNTDPYRYLPAYFPRT